MGEENGLEKHAALRERVLHSIRQDELRRAKRYLFVWGAGMVASLFGAALSLWYVFVALYYSGFYDYLSLLVSDFDIVQSYPLEFALSLSGSVPLIAVITTFAATLLFLVSLRSFARSARGGFALV